MHPIKPDLWWKTGRETLRENEGKKIRKCATGHGHTLKDNRIHVPSD